MLSASELADLVQLGHDMTSVKSYSIGVTALWFYDYFLTLDDEIRYAWKTDNLFMLILYFLTRYIPAPFLAWTALKSWSFSYTPEMCKRTGSIEIVYFTLITGLAQIVLTQRTYAITWKNKWAAGIMYAAAAIQFGIGFYMSIYVAENKAAEMSTIPLEAYHMCFLRVEKTWVIIQISLSLVFDIGVLVFVIVQTQILKSRSRGITVLSILDTVTRDAVIYFVVISSAHFLAVIMYSTARPMLRGIAPVGNAALIPMMITRVITSLKKAANKPQSSLNGLPISLEDYYSPRQMDDIPLSVVRGERS